MLVQYSQQKQEAVSLTGQFAGFWRYRIGNYRLLVQIDDETVTIIAISILHRSIVYKK